MPEAELIDTHCHLEKAHNRGELEAWLSRAAEANVRRAITVGTSTDDWSLYRDLANANEGKIYYTVGLHPCHVEEGWQEQVSQLGNFFNNDQAPIALGEIGLDAFHLPNDKAQAEIIYERQKEAFREQLKLIKKLNCPFIVHSRNTFDDCVAEIDTAGVDWKDAVFHCFAEGPDKVAILNERGGRASFTGIVTYKSAEDVRQSVLRQGADLIMVETDAPYLAPVPHRGKENEPAYVTETAKKCAELLGISSEAFAIKSSENARAFFKL